LAHLTFDDLNEVVSIGAYWDTLGWVYFQQNNLDAAERYIRSAWLLNQHGEVGDHLARVFEKRGLKGEAIRTYAMAIAAAHSVLRRAADSRHSWAPRQRNHRWKRS